MTCPGCGHENPPGQKFCGDCGARLASRCGACGAANPPDQRFCGDCGRPLTGTSAPIPSPPAQPAIRFGSPDVYTPRHLAERILTSKAAIEGERKQAPIADMADDELARALTELQTAEFLYETRLFPDLEYTFKHALTHETAYASVLHERRRALHAAIVETIERLHADRLSEQVEILAHHAVRGGLTAQAVRYLRQAGEKAMNRSAALEAVGFFETALGMLAGLPETTETLSTSSTSASSWLRP